MRTQSCLATAGALVAALTVGAGSASAATAQPKTVAAARVALASEMTALKNCGRRVKTRPPAPLEN